MTMSISRQPNATPQLIANYRCHTGENPLWNPVDRRLYWCDIPQGRIFRYDPARNTHEQYYEGGVVGGFAIETDGSLLLFMARGAVARLANGELTSIISEIQDETGSRFNDVLADPLGRVFCGTMATETRPGRLYRLDPDGKLTMMLEGILCSNGMAFSLDRSKMYYADSFAREIYLFDFDQQAGTLSNRRLFVKTTESDGFPDGMTIDAEGYLWSAQWDGSCLIRYTPEGKEDRRVHFPTLKVSSITFGGDDYSDMYVTTAGGDDPATNGEHAGSLFHMNAGVRGVAEFHSRLGSIPNRSA
jgi:sugar lactone lactonase YvrE